MDIGGSCRVSPDGASSTVWRNIFFVGGGGANLRGNVVRIATRINCGGAKLAGIQNQVNPKKTPQAGKQAKLYKKKTQKLLVLIRERGLSWGPKKTFCFNPQFFFSKGPQKIFFKWAALALVTRRNPLS